MRAGGAERVMALLVSRLGSDNEVTLMTWENPDAVPFYPLPQEIKLIQAGLLGSRGLERAWKFFLRPILVRMELSRSSPDVLISFMDTMNMVAILASIGSGVPAIVSERVDPTKHSIGRIRSFARRFLYMFASTCVVQTKGIQRYFERIPGLSVQVIPNPILPQEFRVNHKQPNESGKFTIVSMGRLEQQKGFDVLIRAFGIVAHHDRSWQLVIYGEGSERKSLERLVSSHDLCDRVFLPGITREPASELARSHIVAFPSRFEGFPNSLGEAMAVGLPAVANRGVSGIEELVQHNISGLLVSSSEDEVAWSNALLRLMGDAQLRQQMGDSALQRCKQWAPEGIFEMWRELISAKCTK